MKNQMNSAQQCAIEVKETVTGKEIVCSVFSLKSIALLNRSVGNIKVF